MKDTTFGFIGLGLIGGSIARAIRQNLPQSQASSVPARLPGSWHICAPAQSWNRQKKTGLSM